MNTNQKLLFVAISTALMSTGAILNTVYAAASSKDYPAQCVNPATGELKPNAAHHEVCADAVKDLGGENSEEGTTAEGEVTVEGESTVEGEVTVAGETTAEGEVTAESETTVEGEVTAESEVPIAEPPLVVSELSLEVVATLVATDITALTPEQVSQFGKEQLASLSLEAMVGFAVEQISVLSIEAVAGFTVMQLDVLSDAVKLAFTPEQRQNMVAYIFPPSYPVVAEEPIASEEPASTELPEVEDTGTTVTGGTVESDDEVAEGDDTVAEDDEVVEGDDTTAGDDEVVEEDDTAAGDDEVAEGEEPATALPELGAVATTPEGETVSTTSTIEGGVAVNGEIQETVNLADEVNVSGEITVDPAHVEQLAEVVVYAAYSSLDGSMEQPIYYMLGENGAIQAWDEATTNLVPFIKLESTIEIAEDGSATLSIPMYSGKFVLSGQLSIYFGYRLVDGTVVTNEQPMEVSITEPAEEVPVETETVSDMPATDEVIPTADTTVSEETTADSATSTEVPAESVTEVPAEPVTEVPAEPVVETTI